MSAKIERAYKNDPSGTVEVGEEMKFKIDFKTMTETCLNSNDTMKVYRRPCEGRLKYLDQIMRLTRGELIYQLFELTL
jgi:hypothetical protein